MADYLESVEQYPVRSQVKPGDILQQITRQPPEKGEPFSELFEDFKRIILPGMTHWQHPRFFAYFSANSSPPSILAEILTTTLAAQCMLWETSPAANELETRMLEWLRQLIDLPEAFTGSIQDSASSATLCALIAARERATQGQAARTGLHGHPPLTIYTSAEAHSSVEKGARIAGFGADQVRKVTVTGTGAMDPQALTQALNTDREAGLLPACVVASLGATGLGSIDPLREIGAITAEQKVFLHVDAAWAGSALILPEQRVMLGGIEFADSFVFNPHKWLFTNFDCSAFYLKNPDELVNALAIMPAYLESAAGEQMPEYRDWGVPLGRRFRALKLWFVLRSYGAERLQTMIRNHIDWAAALADNVAAHPDFELVSGPTLALIAFQLNPRGLTGPQLDIVNEELLRRINDDGRTYLTKTRAHGRTVIRLAVGQTYTEQRHVHEAWSTVTAIAAELLAPGELARVLDGY
ncbi:aminotransferase class V-fold PLP-dependent enzyme [Exilibacterium tricleocarpae]|uniref:Aminotransferase class V-fold PLP-dependent enzyme n=2 Tax=Exilibacterium tricleocarpae TaxID=2591008 RepID=A0A545TM24_9GAMM|nr:aminotransferase class V-fold PLP-dependent enzyme [Exilibacterium tricleocarpae]